MGKKTNYTEDSIQSLDPREHVRLRPQVYMGATDTPNHLLLEIFSNALDEYNIGHGKVITVTIDGNTATCVDEGQGFIIDSIRDDGKSVVEAAFSVLNSSGKFSDDGVYGGNSLGTNGQGGKIANFLSKRFEVKTYRDKKVEYLVFEDGILISRSVDDWKSIENPHGTSIKFTVDSQFFENPNFSVTHFNSFFHDISCLCPGLTIMFNGKKIRHDSIVDMIDKEIGKSIETVNNRLVVSSKQGSNSFDLAMSFCSDASSRISAYVNYGLTLTGPHITSIKSTITRVINNWAKENGLLKKNEKNLDGAAIQEGMILVFNIVAQNVAYEAQIKTNVSKIDSSFAVNELSKQLEIWLDNNPNDGKNIIEKALTARAAAEAAKKARKIVKEKANKKEKVFKLPTTLTDCWSKNRSECELLICEGKSAASGLVAARDGKFQAVYGVRGKMISALKTTPEKLLANQEVNNLVQALGLECDQKTAKLKYDKSKLRYGKIIACADADPDGKLIENLLFNILWFMCPELFINGHVYSAVPPLYRVTTKKNEYVYLRGDEELSEYKKAHPNKSYQISRNKGLGEQNSEELSYCLLEPETRNVLRLTVEDMSEVQQMFLDLYGKKVEPRVKFLNEHLEEANID